MADPQQVLAAAANLGALIATTSVVSSYKEILRQLDLDIGAKNLLQQYEQLIEMLTAKEAQMQPIEVAEKKQFEQLQQSIMMNPMLKKFATVQGEYMDFMRKVQESINAGMTSGAVPTPTAAALAALGKISLDT